MKCIPSFEKLEERKRERKTGNSQVYLKNPIIGVIFATSSGLKKST